MYYFEWFRCSALSSTRNDIDYTAVRENLVENHTNSEQRPKYHTQLLSLIFRIRCKTDERFIFSLVEDSKRTNERTHRSLVHTKDI